MAIRRFSSLGWGRSLSLRDGRGACRAPCPDPVRGSHGPYFTGRCPPPMRRSTFRLPAESPGGLWPGGSRRGRLIRRLTPARDDAAASLSRNAADAPARSRPASRSRDARKEEAIGASTNFVMISISGMRTLNDWGHDARPWCQGTWTAWRTSDDRRARGDAGARLAAARTSSPAHRRRTRHTDASNVILAFEGRRERFGRQGDLSATTPTAMPTRPSSSAAPRSAGCAWSGTAPNSVILARHRHRLGRRGPDRDPRRPGLGDHLQRERFRLVTPGVRRSPPGCLDPLRGKPR